MNRPGSSSLRLLAEGLSFPEGPTFASDGTLWCVELRGGALVCLRDKEVTRVPTGGAPNGAAVDGEDRVWFCDAGQNAIRRFDPRSGEIETITTHVNGQSLNKPNDLAFDDAGNLAFTCPGDSRREPSGYVCCLSCDCSVSIVAGGLFFPNGLAFTADGRELVVAETYRQRLWRGPWDAWRREWPAPRVWADGLRGVPGPDGMALGADGYFYVAVFGSSRVQILAPDGSEAGTLVLPGRHPTNCAFDPTGRLGLVVTEAEQGALWSFPGVGPGIELFRPRCGPLSIGT